MLLRPPLLIQLIQPSIEGVTAAFRGEDDQFVILVKYGVRFREHECLAAVECHDTGLLRQPQLLCADSAGADVHAAYDRIMLDDLLGYRPGVALCQLGQLSADVAQRDQGLSETQLTPE
jgi:hypothetical protein